MNTSINDVNTKITASVTISDVLFLIKLTQIS